MNKELKKRLDKIPKNAPFSEVVKTINQCAIDDMYRKRWIEMTCYSPPINC